MKAWIKRTTGLFLGAILALALNGKAYADVEAEPELPDTPPAVHEEMEAAPIVTEEIAVNDAAAPTVTAVPVADVSLEAVVTNEERSSSETLAALSVPLAAVDADVSVPLSAAAVADSSEQSPLFSVGGVIFDGSADQSEGWGDRGGWKYEADSGRIAMVNFDGSDQSIASDGAGVTIVAAGLNRMESISCEGDINLIGSGILLVDSIEMPEGSKLNLLPNREIYGEDGGSVAVFAKTGENTYTLVNGEDVVGLLDGEYEVPEGITLVVPEDASLCLQSVVQVTETYEQDGQEVTEVRYYTDTSPEDQGLYNDLGSRVEFVTNAALLRVSNLVVQKGSDGKAGEVELRNVPYLYAKQVVSTLNVTSQLILDGLIQGSMVNLDAGIKLQGEGSFENCEVTLGGSEETNHVQLHLSDSSLNITGANVTVDELGVSGGSLVRYTADTVLGDVSIDDGSVLQIRSNSEVEDSSAMTFSGSCSGGQILLESGRFDLRMSSEDLASSSTNILVKTTSTSGLVSSDALVFDYAGYFDERSDTPLIISPDQAICPEASETGLSIPVVRLSVKETMTFSGNTTAITSVRSEDPYSVTAKDNFTISYDRLMNRYSRESDAQDSLITLFEVLIKNSNDTLSMVIASEDNPVADLPVDGIYMIRIVDWTGVDDGQGGGAITTTSISFTGSGVLGGSGAGSVTGGNSKAVYSGNGISRNRISIPGIDPVDPVDPPSPDPVEPVKPTVPEQHGAIIRALHVETTVHGESYTLAVFDQNGSVTDLGGAIVTVRMAYMPPEDWNGGRIYVVFRNADGSLTAYEASFDPATGMLVFESGLTGKFVVVSLNYEGEVFSEDFYTALEVLPAVKNLR